MMRSCRKKFRPCYLLLLCIIILLSLLFLNLNFAAMFPHSPNTRQFVLTFNEHFFNNPPNASAVSRCQSPLFMLVYVHTAPNHFEQRKVIRYTWGHPNVVELLNFTVIFMLGNTTDETVQSGIEREMETYNDIIQFSSFLDTYRNLSFKAIESIKWIWESCRIAEFVVKSDDDMLINMFGVAKLLLSLTGDKHPGNKFICCKWVGTPIPRNKNNKWYVSESEMKGKEYPPFCPGAAYVFPMQLTGRLYDAIPSTHFLWVDDVYATGLLANTSGAGFLPINSRFNFSAGMKHTKELIDEKLLFAHVAGDQGIRKRMIIWEDVLKANLRTHK